MCYRYQNCNKPTGQARNDHRGVGTRVSQHVRNSICLAISTSCTPLMSTLLLCTETAAGVAATVPLRVSARVNSICNPDKLST
jgi:hypothetical protein